MKPKAVYDRDLEKPGIGLEFRKGDVVAFRIADGKKNAGPDEPKKRGKPSLLLCAAGRTWRWCLFRVRAVGRVLWGADAKQTEDLLGVTMPDGEYVGYGSRRYRALWWMGRIRRP